MRAYLLMVAFVVACGGGDEAPPPVAKAPTAAGAKGGAPAAKGGKTKDLKPMRRIEDRVTCPVPSDAKKCDPKTPLCGAGQYCVGAGTDHYCGPCPERDAIRHVFKPRDFQGADIRDPFVSFVILQPGLGAGPEGKVPTEVTPKCTRKDQFQAGSYAYQALKLMGIVAQGAQRKALLSDGRMGYIIKKGDCVGKEKAFVKDIGAGFITFLTEAAGKVDGVEYSMQLYPTGVTLTTPDAVDPGASNAPIVAPPTRAQQQPAPEQTPGTTTTIIQNQPQQQPVPNVPPPQPVPTQLQP